MRRRRVILPSGFQEEEDVDAILHFFIGNMTVLKLFKRSHRRRRFWAAPRVGLWEAQFLGGNRLVGHFYADWEKDRLKEHFRVTKEAFHRLHSMYGHL